MRKLIDGARRLSKRVAALLAATLLLVVLAGPAQAKPMIRCLDFSEGIAQAQPARGLQPSPPMCPPPPHDM